MPLRYDRPDHCTSQFPRSFAHCRHEDRIGKKAVHPLRYCFRIGERHQDAAIVRKQLLRMPARRGYDCFPCAEAVCQRAGSNLGFVEIRRDVDVSDTDEFFQFSYLSEKDLCKCNRLVGAFRKSVRCSIQTFRNHPEPTQRKEVRKKQEYYSYQKDVCHEAMRCYEKRREEFVETFNRTSNQTIDLFEKTLGVYQATSVTDAQRRVQDLIESSLTTRARSPARCCRECSRNNQRERPLRLARTDVRNVFRITRRCVDQ